MASCLIALGSNLGERVGNLQSAIGLLRNAPGVSVVRTSSFVETLPVGGPADQPRFFNAALVLETELPPAAVLPALLSVEQQLGRIRGERCGPRTIDLDLLLYDQQVVETPELTLPHPRMHLRRFVLAPAAEIAPDWRHPALGRSLAALLKALPPDDTDKTGLQVFTDPRAIQAKVLALRREGLLVGLVPTMGALHAGHLSLVQIARRRADRVAASIFVNPTQFGPREDFSRYPRSLDDDLAALSEEGCDLVFVPSAADMYPPGFSTYVEPPAVAAPLEGVCRPGHFRGVATIVLKLFHLLPADFACFGQKDYQQLQVIRRMTQDLALPIEIVAGPTIREPDGLAMSSRNRYLSPAERQRALSISRALAQAAESVAAGERDASRLSQRMRATLQAAGIDRIDYATIADAESLAELQSVDRPAVALIAAHVGTTRLIDNRLLSESHA